MRTKATVEIFEDGIWASRLYLDTDKYDNMGHTMRGLENYMGQLLKGSKLQYYVSSYKHYDIQNI
jgi:hypothetical protein